MNRREECCKIAAGRTAEVVERALICLKTISDAGLTCSIRVPKLLGLVRAESDTVIGLLEEYIRDNPEASSLRKVDMNAVAKPRRAKYVSQVRETISKLHNVGVVWGDGKPENVLIDVNDDAWVIDFGGSWTRGWVVQELAGTRHGDEQARQKIVDFLKI